MYALYKRLVLDQIQLDMSLKSKYRFLDVITDLFHGF